MISGHSHLFLAPGRSLAWAATLALSAALIPAIFSLFAVSKSEAETSSEKAAWNAINSDTFLKTVKALSSDEFEGRAPASKGETLTVDYLEKRFKELGLEPGNPDGTYVQKVPMVGITADPATEMDFMIGPTAPRPTVPSMAWPVRLMKLKFGDDFVVWTKHVEPNVEVNGDLVFVGYGVVAPEYNWDDYKGADLKGKVLVMLINDPPVPDPNDPTRLDPNTFKGKAMTYYGRWTYKFEIAAKLGAAAALIVHETGPAGYPWAVVHGSNTGEQFTLVSADKGRSRCPVEGWITREKAEELFRLAGKDFDTLHKAAVRREFKPVPLGAQMSISIKNTIRTIDSQNVMAKLPGSDSRRENQYVVYTAHWDHLGIGPEVNGDRIYHGAVDNASGVAGLLELARAFTKVRPAPRRSILFISVTAEEKGLLGSQYYSEHPLYPLRDAAAEINMDGLNVLGRTRDITVIGLGNSTLDDYIQAVAAEQGRSVKPDPEPEKGYYFRSDHFNFAKRGVPALDPGEGVEFIGRPEGWGLMMRDKYTAEDYHKPSDKIKPDWDLSGAVEDLQLLFSVGYRIANADQLPTWKPGSEFKAKREAMLRDSVAR